MAKKDIDNFDVDMENPGAEQNSLKQEDAEQNSAEQKDTEQTAAEQEDTNQTGSEQENAVKGNSEQDSLQIDDLISDNPPADDDDEFEAIDVSEPRAPVKEMEIIEEALAIRRRDWIKTHLSYIYAVIGVIVVGLIVFGIYMYYQSTNPMSRFVGSLSKDFSSSFDYDVKVTEDDKPVMSYTGAISVNRSKHEVESVYQADYNSYTYTGAVYAHEKTAVKGSFYNNRWTTHDCADSAQDFFEFDKAFRSGGFDGGAFLRFTGLTSDYSTRELNAMVKVLKKRLSTNSSIATITTEKIEGGTRFDYTINVYELFSMIKENGASVFYRATDYDKFAALFEANKAIIEAADCKITFIVDSAGYMTAFDMTMVTDGKSYGLSCRMSNFSNAEVELPDGFMKAAQLTPES